MHKLEKLKLIEIIRRTSFTIETFEKVLVIYS